MNEINDVDVGELLGELSESDSMRLKEPEFAVRMALNALAIHGTARGLGGGGAQVSSKMIPAFAGVFFRQRK